MAISPGTYLRLRREASGQSIEDVASLIATTPPMDEHGRAEWLRLIERDEAPIGAHVAATLQYAFPFSWRVLRDLGEIHAAISARAPRLCRKCACSEFDPCDPPCGWAGPELCTSCPDDAPANAPAPIDDEEPKAAPSPDDDDDGSVGRIAA